VAYEDIYDAKNACDHLSGFNVANRYLIVLYYNPQRINKKVSCVRVTTTILLRSKREGSSWHWGLVGISCMPVG